jgi:uncharacterized lipoprotein YajG
MRMLLALYLILSLFAIFLLTGCATTPTHGFKPKWEFCEVRPQVYYACLSEDDVKTLHKTLKACKP